jgi:limonene-1,2-epoxide hydrolase
MASSPLSRERTRAAFERHRAIHEAACRRQARWSELAELFADDASYEDPFFGRIAGREAIRDFLERSMSGLEDWTFPIQWVVLDEGRVVTHWLNRLPGRRRDGSHFEFPGMSAIAFDDDERIVSQRDLYDRVTALRVISEAKVPGLERVVGGAAGLSGAFVDVVHRLVGQKA